MVFYNILLFIILYDLLVTLIQVAKTVKVELIAFEK